ncbi:hypothetical protein A2875_02430 [Candidatus Gottesmanbacteria bacterium RIFCSPHIGHO2_01_FULL_46_14]|uniref:Membrane protein 6-pyruvoyl-tetrahydropterin synthase-related domain-containing protein n=2 Tax=Candidatus Gottesmaniibacteriota TaxID=1752720 RepID=A0A1F5ZMM0_9BACT|nr:MAG: hypothetical protein A2875_02430 [Candidatus Gottesmanbacteria bacterium RIFCSPHIGHO2_01_FULL_46_14]OGG28686.1 MAG: hypothetical protein A2971_02540 [Candidatus Gottesmanbacteria bacterium RIFCSPLOWO2_01_FULL_46_21]
MRLSVLHQYLLIVAISLLPFIPFFTTNDIPHTHDGPVHLARMAAYYKAITGGQILPRWASDLNYGYGMPLFNFIYHTPYLVSVPFISLGLGLVNTFKVVLALSFVFSGIGMFMFSREFWRNDRIAFFATVFYQFAPFRLVETHVRGSFGEAYTYAAFPFVLYGIVRKNIFITAVAGAFLILSHNSVSLLFFALAATFAFVTSKTWRVRVYQAGALAGALALSATYWLPAIVERKFTYGDLFMKDVFQMHFPQLYQLFIPNFTNAPTFLTEGISVQIGIFHVIALFFARDKTLWRYIILWSLIALFFMQPISSFLWRYFPILRQFQFPWRFLSIFVIMTTLASGLLMRMRVFQKPLMYCGTLALVIVSTLYFWNPPLGFDTVSDEGFYWNYPLNTTYYGETDVVWSAGPHQSYPPSPIQVASGDTIVTNIEKRSTQHTFQVSSTTESTIVDNTQYFPGWRAYVDGTQVPIEFQDINWRGLITFSVPPGQHSVRVAFGHTPVRLIANVVSVSTLLFLLLIWVKKKYFYH